MLDKSKTFAAQKQLLKESYYDWCLSFPSTAIHENSIMFRDGDQNRSFRRKQELLNQKLTKGRTQFSGSCQDLSPKKGKISTLSRKLTRSEYNLKEMDEKELGKSPSLLNIIGKPFGLKSETSDRTWADRIARFWKRRSSAGRTNQNSKR